MPQHDTPATPITLADIAPELREAVRKLPRAPISTAIGRWLIRKALPLLMRPKPHDGITVETHTLSKRVSVRVYTPTTGATGAALLWIHGGGLVFGSALQDDAFCAETAHDLNIVVVSVEYRLAPDFPFPAALDDCAAAWKWLLAAAAQRQIDTSRIAIGGESAGGGLAASLAQRLHDDGGIQPAAQWLFCPMLDDRTAANRGLDVVDHKVWNNQQNLIGWRSYLAQAPGAQHVPAYAVPARRDDLSGLPPAWIGVGDIDLFFAEDSTYAERLKAAGVPCTFTVVPAAPHGFQTIARTTPLARQFVSDARAWLRDAVTAPSTARS